MDIESYGLLLSRSEADLRPRIGPTYLVGYLGSAILARGKTGLGCLQQPLHELYSIFRQNLSRLNQERRLIVSHDGITMIFNEFGIEKFLFNEIASVHDILLVRLVCEKRKDRRIYAAFLPLGEEYETRRFSSLFYALTKVDMYHLEGRPHAPLIVLIMRRSSGVHALECHVFIARSSCDATSIVNSIRDARRKHELAQETLLFNYKPFNPTQIPIHIETEPRLNRLSSKSTQSLFGKLKANLKEKPKKETHNLTETSTHTIQSLPSAFSTVKKTKKTNLGKRLIESTKKKSKINFGSSSDSGSETKHFADIDFRKSKASIIDENLLIDESKPLHQSQHCTTKVGDVFISNENNFILKSRSEPSTHPRLTKHQIQQINEEFNQFYNDGDGEENERGRRDVKSGAEKREEALANHLVWNKSSRSAESLDRLAKQRGVWQGSRNGSDGVARAISPGNPLRLANLNERNLQSPMSANYVSSCYSNSSRTSTPMTDNNQQCHKTNYFNRNNYQFIPKKFNQQNLDSLKENSFLATCEASSSNLNMLSKDSAYNTCSSKEESDHDKFTILRSSFSNRSKAHDEKLAQQNITKWQKVNLADTKPNVQLYPKQQFEYSTNNETRNKIENEIIDLTKKVNLSNFEANFKDIPIQTSTSYRQERTTTLNNLEPFQSRIVTTNFTMPEKHYLSKSQGSNVNERVSLIDETNQKITNDNSNCVYFYSDDAHFFGY